MLTLTINIVVLIATSIIAVWLANSLSLLDLIVVPVVVGYGPLLTMASIVTKLLYYMAVFLILAGWLFYKESYSPIAPPGVLALLGFWFTVSFSIFACGAAVQYVVEILFLDR